MIGKSPIIIIDTDIHITKSYSKFSFNKELEVSSSIMHSNKADLYFYLNNDVDHIQDGTRLIKKERDLLDKSHRETLRQHEISFVEVKGNWNQRFKKMVSEIDLLISKKRKIQ